MTSNQIAYQQLQEQKRHNLATEGIDRGKVLVSAYEAAIKRGVGDAQATSYYSSAFANILNAQTNQGQVLVNAYEAATRNQVAQSTIFSNYLNAVSAYSNAQSNRVSALSNAMNAETNRLNYGVNLANAQTNQLNAIINMGQLARNIRYDERNYELNKAYYELDSSKMMIDVIKANRQYDLDVNAQNITVQKNANDYNMNSQRNMISLITGTMSAGASLLGGVVGGVLKAGLIG